VCLFGSVPVANQRRFEEFLTKVGGEGLVKHGAKDRGLMA